MRSKMMVAGLCLATSASYAGAEPKSGTCYGREERQLAEVMLEVMPALQTSLMRQEQAAKMVRQQTCTTLAKNGRIARLGYASQFFGELRNRPVLVASKERNLDPLRVQAALVDLIWPPLMI